MVLSAEGSLPGQTGSFTWFNWKGDIASGFEAVSALFPIPQSSVVVRDFNSDGRADLAITNPRTNSVSVALGNGDGTFQRPLEFAVGTRPRSIAVGDFNGDGKPDLAVVNDGSNNVSVLLGNGDGTFHQAVHTSLNGFTSSIAVADFNRDGRIDLAVADGVLLGNGDGTFQPARSFPRGRTGICCVADFNGDGIPDLAATTPETPLGTTGACSSNSTTSSCGIVLLGNGDGTFRESFRLAFGSSPELTGDFNGDGRPDIIMVSIGTILGGLSIGGVMKLGNGDGTFRDGPTPEFIPSSSAVGDFNGDGKLDIVSRPSFSLGAGSMIIALGRGDGSFQVPSRVGAGLQPWAFAVGDFNNDGKPDVALTSAGPIAVALGNGDGTFAPLKPGLGKHPRSAAAGDFNGDGRLDLAVANFGSDSISVLPGNGDGTFQTALNLTVGTAPNSVAVGDFNADGRLDLAVANKGLSKGLSTVSVLLGKGDGTLQPTADYQLDRPRFISSDQFDDPALPLVAVGDFNGDGRPDLLVGAQRGEGGASVYTLLGEGDGTFRTPLNFQPVPLTGHSISVGDFNGDGKLDLALSSGFVRILLGAGDGTFGSTPAATLSIGNGLKRPSGFAAAADFNGDGELDLAVSNSGVCCTVGVLLGNGDGTFREEVNSPAPGLVPGGFIAAADFDGDGKLDLVWAAPVPSNYNLQTGYFVALRGNGDGTFQAGMVFLVGADPLFIAVGDFSNDGKPDLAVINSGSITRSDSSPGWISVHINTTRGGGSFVTIVSAANGAPSVAPGSIASAYGSGLSLGTEAATSQTLPIILGGSSLQMRDGLGVSFPAPLFYASPGQINFLVPPGISLRGAADLSVTGSGRLLTGTVNIRNVAPALFTATGTGRGVAAALAARVEANGEQTSTLIYQCSGGSACASVPIELTAEAPVSLVLFGTGIRNRSALTNVSCLIRGVTLPVQYAGPQGSFTGLDQVNVTLPFTLRGSGEVDLRLTVDNVVANTVRVNIK